MGLLCTAVLNINNMRDIENDKNSAKRTIPVQIGFKYSKYYHYLLICLSIFLILAGPMTVIPLFLYVRGVELIGLGPTGMIFYITPTLQFILGYFYYGEDFSLVKFLSFIIIWFAVVIYLKDLYETN
mgnify:CR=1 FL=1